MTTLVVALIAGSSLTLRMSLMSSRNTLILNQLGTLAKTTVSKQDDIKDILNVKLDPAINATTKVVTNQSGFNVLDKLKDAPMINGYFGVVFVPPFGKYLSEMTDTGLPNNNFLVGSVGFG